MTTAKTNDQRALLLTALEQRRDQLSEQLARHLHGNSRVDQAANVAGQDADDAPQRAPEREIAMALSDHQRRELDAVTAALQRMERGAYGMCADCGIAIPIERLMVEPWALRCIACETAFEKNTR